MAKRNSKAAPARAPQAKPAEQAPVTAEMPAVEGVEEVVAAACSSAAASPADASVQVAPQPDLSAQAAALEQLRVCLDVRERALRALEASLAGSLAELDARTAALAARERAVSDREDDVSIREAAVDEAMSLGQVLAPAAASRPAADGFLEGPAQDADDLLEGPGMVLEAPPVSVPQVAAQTEEQQREAEAAKALLAKKLNDESEQMLKIVAGLPFLHFVEPRVRKAQSEGKVDVDNALGFYNLALRLLREEYDKTLTASRRFEDAFKESEQEHTTLKEGYDQLRDDFERFRNRIKNDQEGMSARASENLLHMIVPVVDNFQRALKASEGAATVAAVLSGVQMISRMFDDVLKQGGLVLVQAEPGLPFEPKTQEAVGVVETDEYPEDHICEVVQRGYTLAGKLFRAAMVKVARPVSPGYRPVADPLSS